MRSADEYAGQAANKGLDGGPLKLGHAPTAVNVDYTLNWTDPDSKAIKPYGALQALYAGLDPNRGVITYCHSGRRGSFSYFVLRLMGFEQVALYDASWFEWGNNRLFFPVETKTNALIGALPGASVAGGAAGGGSTTVQPRAEKQADNNRRIHLLRRVKTMIAENKTPYWNIYPAAVALAGIIVFIFATFGPPASSSGFVSALKGALQTFVPDYVAAKAHYRQIPGPGSWLMAFVLGMAIGGFIAGRTFPEPIRDVPEIWEKNSVQAGCVAILLPLSAGF